MPSAALRSFSSITHCLSAAPLLWNPVSHYSKPMRGILKHLISYIYPRFPQCFNICLKLFHKRVQCPVTKIGRWQFSCTQFLSRYLSFEVAQFLSHLSTGLLPPVPFPLFCRHISLIPQIKHLLFICFYP